MNYMPNVWDVKRAISKVKYKMMNYSELQSATRLATNDEPWNQSNSDLYPLAEATMTTSGLNDVLGVCIERLSPPSRPRPLSRPSSTSLSMSSTKPALSWRSIYKTLGLLEFLIIRGSERVKTFLLLHRSFLAKFVHYSSLGGGHDQEHAHAHDDSDSSLVTTEDKNIRKKATRLLELLDSPTELAMERDKAQENFGKYKGFSNTDSVAWQSSMSSSPSWPSSSPSSPSPPTLSSPPSSSYRQETSNAPKDWAPTTSSTSEQNMASTPTIQSPQGSSDFGMLIHFDQDMDSDPAAQSPHAVAYAMSPPLVPNPSSTRSSAPSLPPSLSPQMHPTVVSSPSAAQRSHPRDSPLSSPKASSSPDWATDLLTLVNDMHVKNTDQKMLKEKPLKELRKV